MKIDKDKFIELCGGDKLKPKQKDGLLFLVSSLERDISDIRWIAYILATVQRECADTYQPIEEYGKGKGRSYGKSINGHVYYGRGYVQLTWLDNYKTMSDVTGYDLVNQPEGALEPPVAYKIMIEGMTKGLFTGVGLKKYINADKCDYIGARRIINGQDCAGKIAKVAEWFEDTLRQSVVEE